MIDLLLATKNQTKTAELLRLGFGQINRIMHQSTQRVLARRGNLGEIHHISIDEKSFKKGHDYITVLSRPETGSILNVSHGRKKENVKLLLNETFNEQQKVGISTVSMDM